MTVSVSREQLHAVYQQLHVLYESLGELLYRDIPEPKVASPPPATALAPTGDDEGLTAAIAEFMRGLGLENPKMPNEQQWERFLNETARDFTLICTLLEYTREQEQRSGKAISSPIAYAYSVWKRDPARFMSDEPTVSPAPARRPSPEDVRRLVEGDVPF